jgi:hypothetical protein
MNNRKTRGETDSEDGPDNVSRLRDAIDHGRTGDKVEAEDPATAPLGTDDEAGGHALRAEHFEVLKAQQQPASPRRDRTATPILALAVVVLLVVAATVLAAGLV